MFRTHLSASAAQHIRIDVLLLVACCTLLLAATTFKSDVILGQSSSSYVTNTPNVTASIQTELIVPDPLENLSKEARSLVEKQVQVDYKSIWMSDLEINLVLRYMNNVDAYIEWGSGGSTFNFPQFAKRAYSIEHSKNWCSRMRADISSHPELKHLQFHCVPIQRGTNGWGLMSAFEEGTYKTFKPYIDHIDNLGEQKFDVVLIDGRARVDAAIKALSYLGKHSVVIVHDAERIWTRRTYADMFTYYDIIDSVGGKGRQGLAVMRRKSKYSYLQGKHGTIQDILNKKYPTTKEKSSSDST